MASGTTRGLTATAELIAGTTISPAPGKLRIPSHVSHQPNPATKSDLTPCRLWTALAVDTALATTLIILVRRRFAASPSPSSPIRHLIAKSLETASYTVILGAAGALVGVAFPQSNDRTANVPLAFTLPLPSLYALSMVVTLASRGRREPVLVTGTVHVTERRGARGGAGQGSDFGMTSGAYGSGGGEKRRMTIDDDLDEELDGEEGVYEEDEADAVEEERVRRARGLVDVRVDGRRESEGSSVEEKDTRQLRWA